MLPHTHGRSTRGVERRTRLSHGRRLAALTAVMALGVGGATSPAFGADQRPDASFAPFPSDPVEGQPVRFVSYGCDPDGGRTEQAWDLDGDGLFDDAFGPSASRTFAAGSRRVSLQVTDNEGRVAVRRRTLVVAPGRPDYVLPEPSGTRLLSPFPIVRLAGRVSAEGLRVRRLTVRSAPVCSRITVRCRGGGCPRRRSKTVMGRRPVRFRAFERNLAAGVVLEVLIRKKDRIGKYTRFRLRESRAPARRDLCLRYEDRRGTRCPQD